MRLTVGVLTVSDRCSRGLREDAGGPALRRLAEARGWDVARHKIVPDEMSEIVEALTRWSGEDNLSLILTTGGTGLGPRDVTPEATRNVLDKELPGLAEVMRLEGLKRTPLAALSRGLCGSRGRTLILNLPGSPKGASESFEAAAGLIPHAVLMLTGAGHAEMERSHDPA